MNNTRRAVVSHAVLIAVLLGAGFAIRNGSSPAEPTAVILPATDAEPYVTRVAPDLPAGPATMPRAADPAITLPPPVIGGRATWYRAHGMIAAAGPTLRGYIGPRWRGALVSVCASATGMCVVVRVSDWCLCTGHGGRLIDLSDDAFAQLAPLAAGVLGVEITRVVLPGHLPPTDTAL